MRAKKVFENINFERGIDPKTSLEIGRNANNDILKYDTVSFKKAVKEAYKGGYGGWELDLEALDLLSKTLDVPEKSILALDPYGNNPEGDELYAKSNIVDRVIGKDVILFFSDRGLIFMMEYPAKDMVLWTLGIDYRLTESYNFERGQDPKKTMKIGKASKVNYFRDNLEGISYKEWMLDNVDWPWGQGRDILEVAADILGVSENEVLIAVEYDNDPLTTSVIEQRMDDHDWEYGDSEGHSKDFDLIQSSTGEIYVVGMEDITPYMILGSAF